MRTTLASCGLAAALLASMLGTAHSAPAPRPGDATGLGDLILSAPPREDFATGARRFQPIADYLSQILGRRVVFRHSGTWGGYQTDMQKGVYDIVFDGPHFVGWRIDKLGHTALIKLPGEFTYVGIVKKDETRFHSLQELAGRTICAHAPPNLGTLIMLNEFPNPARQPVIVLTEGYEQIYEGVLSGRCSAGMLPLKHVDKHDKDRARTREIFRKQSLPQQAFSAGPRLSQEEKERVATALLAPAAAAPLAEFRKAYALGRPLVRATNGEYAGLGNYLKDMRGF